MGPHAEELDAVGDLALEQLEQLVVQKLRIELANAKSRLRPVAALDGMPSSNARRPDLVQRERQTGRRPPPASWMMKALHVKLQ